MWYKKIISTILFVFIIILVIVFPAETKTILPKPEKHGNTESNLLNNGLAIEAQGLIYYASRSGIWKTDNANSEKLMICKDEASYLNLMDGWLYYKNLNEAGIFKIKINGTEKTKICNDNIRSMNIIGENIYYFGSDSSFYKIQTDGSGKTVINPNNSDFINYYSVEEEKLYYTSRSNLVKINLDGTKRRLMASEYVDRFAVSGNWIYYYADRTFQKDALFRMQLDGSEKSVVLEDAYCFNISGDSVYYEKLLKQTETKKTSNSFSIDFDGKKLISLNKRKTDGSKDIKLIDAEAMSINVAGDWIFYNAKEKLFKIKTDGSQNQKVDF